MNEIYGLITAFKRFAVHDGDGIRTTVFLKGCPLSCLWCHNPECISPKAELSYYANKCGPCGECAAACPSDTRLLSAEKHIFLRDKCTACGSCVESCRFNALQLEGKRLSVDEVMKTVLEDIDFCKTSGGGLTISGGEPTMQSEFTLALLKAAKSAGINTALDTCGYTSRRIFEEMLPYVDTFLYDIKHISRIEIRIPIIPSCNDDESTLRGMAELLSEVSVTKVKLLPYHSYAGSKYDALELLIRLVDTPRPSAGHMEWCERFFESCHGLR